MTLIDEFFSRVNTAAVLGRQIANELGGIRQRMERWRQNPDQWRLKFGICIRSETVNVLRRNGLSGDYYWPIKSALTAVDDGEPDRVIELPDGHTMTAWAIVDDLYLWHLYEEIDAHGNA